MILTDELCDQLCAVAGEKSRKMGLISALQSVMRMDCPGLTVDMERRSC